MKLTHLHIVGFRRFLNAEIDLSPPMVVLIGENDSGKTSILDAIEILFGKKKISSGDFWRGGGEHDPAQNVVLEGKFNLDERSKTALGVLEEFVSVRKTFERDTSSTCEILRISVADERLLDTTKLSSPDAKALLTEMGVSPGSNASERESQFEKLRSTADTALRWSKYPSPQFPVHRRISADLFMDPVNELSSVLSASVREALVELESGDDAAFADASEAANAAVDKRLEEVRPFIMRFLPGVTNVLASATVDFLRPQIRCSIDVVDASGRRPLDEFGYGTRRRAWMAIDEAYNQKGRNDPNHAEDIPQLRLYDEPDAALHFEAQRSLFRSIRDSVTSGAARAVVCTHAVTLIDRSPASSLRVVRPSGDGTSSVRPLCNEDETVLSALDRHGASMGLSNLSILFERAFLVVEGDTEERAIPTMYESMYGTRMGDDGIRVVNLDGCGSWRSVVKVLLKARSGLIHFLLDADCLHPNSSAKLTENSMKPLGIDISAMTFVGSKEFEDAFSDKVWANLLTEEYPRDDSAPWSESDITAMRSSSKFSEEIVTQIRSRSVPTSRSNATKPTIGENLGRFCKQDEVPSQVVDAFVAVRRVAGITD